MRMQGRRESTNVRDIRGHRGAKVAGGLGLGGLILAALMAWMSGGNPLNAILGFLSQSGEGGLGGILVQRGDGTQTAPSPEEEALATFSSQILAGTEDIWGGIFKGMGKTYKEPTLVLFTGFVQSGCGGADKEVGPFYCSADQCLYIDLSFFTSMREKLGAGGDFAYAYVIGHEVGHHVQHLLGTLDDIHAKQARVDKVKANELSVRLELQADFLAGVWAHHDNARFKSLEKGDIEKAIRCAQVIGDDYLQKKARGYVQKESFTHGSSEQRVRWFTKGWETGDLSARDTFSMPFDEL